MWTRRIVWQAVVAVISVSISSATSESKCHLEPGRVDQLRVGMTVDEVYRAYGEKNIRLVNLRIEGLFSPAIEVYSDSLDQKRFTADFKSTPPDQIRGPEGAWHIWRIHVHDPRCRTESGIGVGSTYGELRRTYRISDKGRGEDAFYAIVSDLGMSFALSPWQEGGMDDAKIKSILLLKPAKKSAD